MRLITNRPLTFAGVLYGIGEEFECPDRVGEELLRRADVQHATPPQILYETKVVVPQPPRATYETKAQQQNENGSEHEGASEVSAHPFRDGESVQEVARNSEAQQPLKPTRRKKKQDETA